MVATQVRPNYIELPQLSLQDPILNLLAKITRQKALPTALLVLAVFSICMLGGGYVISLIYQGSNFLPMYDRRDWPYDLFLYVFATPIGWIFYVHEPLEVKRIFESLLENGVLTKSTPNSLSLEEFIKKEILALNQSKRYLSIVIGLTLLIIMIWISTFFVPQNPFRFGYQEFWWTINRFYFVGVFLPLVGLNIYVDIWIFTRRALTVFLLNKILGACRICPQLFHPDQSNGFAAIGDYSVKVSPLVAIAGLWVYLTIAYPTFFGEPLNLKYDTIIFLIIYAAVIPTFLLLPVRKIHFKMKNAKAEALEVIAKKIRPLLVLTEDETFMFTSKISLLDKRGEILDKKGEINQTQELGELMSSIESLERRYRLIEREQITWPFRRLAVGGYFFTTALPLILTLISIIIQFIAILPKH